MRLQHHPLPAQQQHRMETPCQFPAARRHQLETTQYQPGLPLPARLQELLQQDLLSRRAPLQLQ